MAFFLKLCWLVRHHFLVSNSKYANVYVFFSSQAMEPSSIEYRSGPCWAEWFIVILCECNLVLGSVVVDHLSYLKTVTKNMFSARCCALELMNSGLDTKRRQSSASSNSRWCSVSAAASTWSGDTSVLGWVVHTFNAEQTGNPRCSRWEKHNYLGTAQPQITPA